ncbi:MAG: glycosyltransferase family 4 protein [Caldivirga sp.]
MRVLHLSWEYPPHIVGGLGRHVYHITHELVKLGVSVDVATIGYEDSHISDDGVNVHLVDAFKVRVPDFSSWVHSFNIFMVTELSHISGIDLVHVHDWLTAPAGIVLKHRFKVPLIATIHATEYGRRGGLHSLESRHIHEWEWLLAYEAWKVIVCSSFMANEVKSVLGVPSDKVIMIPNGVDKSLLNFKPKYERSNYALPWELLIVFYGRLVYEKGPDSVIRAFAKLLTRLGNVKLVIIGDGPMREHLVNLANQLGLGSKVYFTGRVSDDELYSVIYHSNLVILPSRYEPFGISSLEAMALGKPLITTNRGGPTDFVRHMDNGILANPDNPDEIAYYAEMVLKDEGLAKRLGERARETVTKGYTWDIIARKTYETYKAILEERARVNW